MDNKFSIIRNNACDCEGDAVKINIFQEIISDANLIITQIKVNGGYVVNSYDKSHNILGSCFVTDLRTHLAGMAMQGLFSQRGMINIEADCSLAVKFADALIAELNKEQK